LAKEQKARFVELDSLIEERAGLTLTEIFSLHGEGYYRRLETACLRELLDSTEKMVVALSGGIVHNIEAFERLKQDCVTVWLKADSGDYMRRVLEQGDFRPVANRENAMSELEALVSAREPFYNQATIAVNTSSLSVAEVVSSISSQIL
jgi:XRE family aerobic/anaerobic benzoate catabolism transcriptional regulator